MDKDAILTEEQLDFLKEMFSIGAGNAATAFSQLLECKVEIEMPKMTVQTIRGIWDSDYYDTIYTFCTMTKMAIAGDIIGDLFFIMKDEFVPGIVEVMLNAGPKIAKPEAGMETADELQESMILEFGNIFAGTYLGAISRFCKMNIIHTLPILEKEKLFTFLERFIVSNCSIEDLLVMIEIKFIAGGAPFEGLLLIVLSKETIGYFVKALGDAKGVLGVL